jgi:type IV secretion system protein VirB8
MSRETDEVSALLRSGEYYHEARRWYGALYIGPISERSYFLIIAVLAGLITLVAMIALSGLLPLADKPGLVISNPRIDSTAVGLVRLRRDGQSVDEAVRDYVVAQYVVARESYSPESLLRNSQYVLAHSAGPLGAEYAAQISPENPRSPSMLLGDVGKRVVRIQGLNVRRNGQYLEARVTFSTEIISVTSLSKTQWTAQMQFLYSGGNETETVDPSTKEETVTLSPPTFQVVQYVLTQMP